MVCFAQACKTCCQCRFEYSDSHSNDVTPKLFRLSLQGTSNEDFDMTQGEAGPAMSEAPPAQSTPVHFPYLSVGGSAPNSVFNDSTLTVQGDITVSGEVSATTLYQTSDEKSKCNITPATHCALSIIEQVPVYWYSRKQDPDGQKQLGVLAHEIRPLLPNAVKADTVSGFEQVNTHSMMYLAVQAIQQLSNQVKVNEVKASGRLGLALVAAKGMTNTSDADPQHQLSINQLNSKKEDQIYGQESIAEAGSQQACIWARDMSEQICRASNIEDPWNQADANNSPYGGMRA